MYVGKRKEVRHEIKVVEIIVMSEEEKGTFAVQLGLQKLVFVGELFVRQQELMVQLGRCFVWCWLGGAPSLRRGCSKQQFSLNLLNRGLSNQ